MNDRIEQESLTTADLVAATQAQAPQAPQSAQQDQPRPDGQRPDGQGEELAALFPPDKAQEFRSRWDEVQIGFVDDPQRAVRQADELVAQVMKNLAETFAGQRAHFEGEGAADGASTEAMRVALRRYRSFFQRLLAL
ncbi:MAG TPA: hypothetical protein VJ743_05270 [Albitalea sp.]|nr:hypothetical protein [Albitalea sp.]